MITLHTVKWSSIHQPLYVSCWNGVGFTIESHIFSISCVPIDWLYLTPLFLEHWDGWKGELQHLNHIVN